MMKQNLRSHTKQFSEFTAEIRSTAFFFCKLFRWYVARVVVKSPQILLPNSYLSTSRKFTTQVASWKEGQAIFNKSWPLHVKVYKSKVLRRCSSLKREGNSNHSGEICTTILLAAWRFLPQLKLEQKCQLRVYVTFVNCQVDVSSLGM